MAGQCWACRRQARGLGHSDNRFTVGHPRRYPMDWVFCSRRCQDAFHALYGQWLKTDPRQEDVLMVDKTEFERAAMRACLKFFGEAAGEIGLAPLPRRAFRATSASSKNFRRAWAKQKAGVAGICFLVRSNNGLKPL